MALMREAHFLFLIVDDAGVLEVQAWNALKHLAIRCLALWNGLEVLRLGDLQVRLPMRLLWLLRKQVGLLHYTVLPFDDEAGHVVLQGLQLRA